MNIVFLTPDLADFRRPGLALYWIYPEGLGTSRLANGNLIIRDHVARVQHIGSVRRYELEEGLLVLIRNY